MEPYATIHSTVEATVLLNPARHSSCKLESRIPSPSRKSSQPVVLSPSVTILSLTTALFAMSSILSWPSLVFNLLIESDAENSSSLELVECWFANSLWPLWVSLLVTPSKLQLELWWTWLPNASWLRSLACRSFLPHHHIGYSTHFGQLHCLLRHLLGSCYLGAYGRDLRGFFFSVVFPLY